MNRDQSRNLIRQTFTHAFDKPTFENFTRNLVNHIDESKEFSRSSQYIKDAFKNHVQRFERLGTYTTPKKETLDVLVVHVTKESKLERTRTALRNFVADHLKARNDKDAALVAFVSPTEKQWRFSFVKMEYATVRNDDGKVGVEAHLTPARRFSYLVGEGESCHTAQTRFLDLLQDTRTDPTLADIEEAFSVEAVTKEFYKEYRKLFEDINIALESLVAKDKSIGEEFKAQGVNTVDFAKKLMGQIVFLYFLQKKGWLGVAKGNDWGSGPRDFLRRLANREYDKYDNFFNDILEPLFYDTLATDRGHEAWCSHFKCRIPFLNGGLFEPLGDYNWNEIDIILPNKLFTNSEYIDEGVTGTGVLDVFDRYNFTVNEAEPLEKEVAIDPEMLGKVFENLIEENLRKGLGSYYTPREVVHYMCQESLIDYLDTTLNMQPKALVQERPKQARLLGEPEPEQATLQAEAYGPIVPRTDIETFVHLGEQISHYESVDTKYSVKMPVSIQKHSREIDENLSEITVCDPAVGSGAFPVGMMTEIVRARCALTPYFNDTHERTPYYFKRQAIQSCLYGVDIDPGAVEIAKLRLWLSLVVDSEEDSKQIRPLPNLLYKIVVGNSLLGVKKTLFNEKLFRELETLKPSYFDETDVTKKGTLKCEIDSLIDRLTDGKKTFDFEIYFSEVFHRFGGFDVMIANPPYGADIDNLLPILRPLYLESVKNYADIYKMFMQLGLWKLRSDGIQALITPNTFVAQPRYKDIRKVLINHRIVKLVNLGEEVFENVIVPTCLSFVMRTQPTKSFYFADVSKGNKFSGDLTRIHLRLASLDQVKSSQDLSLYLGKTLRENEVLFDHALEIKDAGIQYHRSGIGLKKKGGNDLYERLFSSDSQAFKSSVPVWYGKLIDRWVIQPKTDEFFNLDYHRILKSNESVSFTRKVLEVSPKILWRQTASNLRATIDTECRLFRNTIQCAYIKDSYKERVDIYYLLGLINSRYIADAYTSLVKEAGRVFPQVKLTHVKKLPLVIVDKSKQKEIGDLVKRILKAKQHDSKANTIVLEREIDRKVDELYGITEEESNTVGDSKVGKSTITF